MIFEALHDEVSLYILFAVTTFLYLLLLGRLCSFENLFCSSIVLYCRRADFRNFEIFFNFAKESANHEKKKTVIDFTMTTIGIVCLLILVTESQFVDLCNSQI